eukprot:NODE_2_length_91304_cov_0.692462.p30 type:complete len:347 gc:universal NODE_2_length_91304_cov_0.692462:88280-87240(-)
MPILKIKLNEYCQKNKYNILFAITPFENGFICKATIQQLKLDVYGDVRSTKKESKSNVCLKVLDVIQLGKSKKDIIQSTSVLLTEEINRYKPSLSRQALNEDTDSSTSIDHMDNGEIGNACAMHFSTLQTLCDAIGIKMTTDSNFLEIPSLKIHAPFEPCNIEKCAKDLLEILSTHNPLFELYFKYWHLEVSINLEAKFSYIQIASKRFTSTLKNKFYCATTLASEALDFLKLNPQFLKKGIPDNLLEVTELGTHTSKTSSTLLFISLHKEKYNFELHSDSSASLKFIVDGRSVYERSPPMPSKFFALEYVSLQAVSRLTNVPKKEEAIQFTEGPVKKLRKVATYI